MNKTGEIHEKERRSFRSVQFFFSAQQRHQWCKWYTIHQHRLTGRCCLSWEEGATQIEVRVMINSSRRRKLSGEKNVLFRKISRSHCSTEWPCQWSQSNRLSSYFMVVWWEGYALVTVTRRNITDWSCQSSMSQVWKVTDSLNINVRDVQSCRRRDGSNARKKTLSGETLVTLFSSSKCKDTATIIARARALGEEDFAAGSPQEEKDSMWH